MENKENFEIELNNAYMSGWDNVEFPIFELSDGTYLCIAYSQNRNNYYIDTYAKEEFIEQGFEKAEYENFLFKEVTREDVNPW